MREFLRRALPSSVAWEIHRARAGTSSAVYRLTGTHLVRYLRLACEADESFAPEVHVHELLRARGVKVPAVVYFEPFSELLGRSVMITDEIEGVPLGMTSPEATVARVLRAVGRDLAVVNGLDVDGFGFIRRDRSGTRGLEGEYVTQREAFARLDSQVAVVEPFLGGALIAAIAATVESTDALDVTDARLAHGDFDPTHVFQRQGRYSGLIDFGEIRGAHPLYDLAHFFLHERERLRAPAFGHLLDGYRKAAPLADDAMRTISLLSILIGVSTLSRVATRPDGRYRAFLVNSVARSLETFAAAV